jgi:hypothetical protein
LRKLTVSHGIFPRQLLPVKDLYEKGGEAALIEMSRRVPNPRNRIGETIERRILEMTLEQPAWGHTRMANELAKEGLRVSPPASAVHSFATTSTPWPSG